MFDLDRFQEVLSTMRRNALRTTLTAVGVFWGVFLLILMVGMGNGLETGTKKGMRGLATNSLYIWGQRTSLPYEGMQPGRFVRLTMKDAEAMAQIPGVSIVAPRISLGGRRSQAGVSRGDKNANAQVMGDVPEYLDVNPLEIDGRFINRLDMLQRRKVAVIGERIKELLFKDGDPIGQSITVADTDFMVVGVHKSASTGDQGDRDARTVYVPLTTFQKALSNNSPYIHYLSVLSESGVRASLVETSLVTLLLKRHKASPDDKQAVGSFNADAEYQKIMSLFLAIKILTLLVGGATLMAGLVGVSNIMMVSVRERTREIGIRKAIGATPVAVVTQIVSEAVALSSVAGYLGLVAGVGLLELLGSVMDGGGKSMMAAPTVTLNVAIVATVAVALGGGLAGLFPALHAARIRTVTALKDD